jgi:Methyltransferase domain
MAASVLARRRAPDAAFSLDPELIRDILQHARPLGHHEDAGRLNLGFGFLYYGMVRTLRPRHILVIGSGFGFSVVCLALGLKDNGTGELSFVDPSYSVLTEGPFRTVGGTSQWSDPEKVESHFARFGVEQWTRHYRVRSDQFFSTYAALDLPQIDLAFIDGNHSYDNVQHDFIATVKRTRKNSYLLLHDTNIYIREFLRHAGVKRWLKVLKRHREVFELVDFPFSSGVAMVRVLQDEAWKYLEFPHTR